MKKLSWLLLVFLVAGCMPNLSEPALETAQSDIISLEADLDQKDQTIAEMETQIQEMTVSYSSLKRDHEALQASLAEGETAGEKADPAVFLCEDQIVNMKYDNLKSASAVIDGWFATQPMVQELQGTYTVQFWDDIDTRVRTIRYLSAESGLSRTESFLIFFEEAGWQEGVLWLERQCWLDSPH